jgi:hypothetical protein
MLLARPSQSVQHEPVDTWNKDSLQDTSGSWTTDRFDASRCEHKIHRVDTLLFGRRVDGEVLDTVELKKNLHPLKNNLQPLH